MEGGERGREGGKEGGREGGRVSLSLFSLSLEWNGCRTSSLFFFQI